VLGVPPDNAALVFAPTGIGALVGLRFVTTFTRWGKNRTVVIGLCGIAVCLALLALVEAIANIYEASGDWFDPSRLLRVSLLQFLVMCFAAPMGFFYALLNAPAQTILHERAPEDMRGRIFATQVVMANFISLLPLLMVGAMTDLLSVTAVLLLLAIMLGGAALASNAWGYREPELAHEERVPQGVGT
jgi:MFS family permease